MPLILLTCILVAAALAADQPADAFLGRWGLTVSSAAETRASWLEVTRAEGKLAARFVGRSGSVRPVSVEIRGGEIRWSAPSPPGAVAGRPPENYVARLAGGKLEGSGTDSRGNQVRFTGVRMIRPPGPPRQPDWGKPVPLFNGRDLSGWTFRDPRGRDCWSAVGGEIVNKPPCPDLITERKFRDFKLHIEYNLDPKSNSGIYLRGRYEVQIADTGPRDLDSHGLGGVYGFLAPSVRAGKPAGEWQAFDITLVGYYVTVVLNGKTIIDNREIDGITGAALDANESEPGPIMLQGDHGRVRFRNIVIAPGS